MSTTTTNKGQRIGKGTFSTVYLEEGGQTVRIESNDYAKECMAWGWFSDHPLFPDVEFIDRTDEYDVYRMRYYPTAKSRAVVSQLDARNRRLYRALRELSTRPPHHSSPYDYWWDQFGTLPEEFAEEAAALQHAASAMANYGTDVCFEISPRNVATEDGKLILLDCFFIASQLEEVRKR